jgi:hypothetical protein
LKAVGDPDQIPAEAISTWPTWAVPEIVGRLRSVGGVSVSGLSVSEPRFVSEAVDTAAAAPLPSRLNALAML